MLGEQHLHSGGRPVERFDQGRGRVTVLDRQAGERYPCLSYGGFDILRMPIRHNRGSVFESHLVPPEVSCSGRNWQVEPGRSSQKRRNSFGWRGDLPNVAEVIEDKADLAAYPPDVTEAAARTVEGQKSSGGGLPRRLRQLLDGRDRASVLAASGVSDRTLSRALAGEDIRLGTLAALAQTLGVSQGWLIDGIGAAPIQSPRPAERQLEERQEEERPSPAPRPTALFSTLNMDRAGFALARAEQMFADGNARPSHRALMQAMAVIYDVLTEQEWESKKDKAET